MFVALKVAKSVSSWDSACCRGALSKHRTQGSRAAVHGHGDKYGFCSKLRNLFFYILPSDLRNMTLMDLVLYSPLTHATSAGARIRCEQGMVSLDPSILLWDVLKSVWSAGSLCFAEFWNCVRRVSTVTRLDFADLRRYTAIPSHRSCKLVYQQEKGNRC